MLCGVRNVVWCGCVVGVVAAALEKGWHLWATICRPPYTRTRHMTIRIGAGQTGRQPDSISAPRAAQHSQKRACPHSMSAKPSPGATRHTSWQSSVGAASVAGYSDDSDVVADDAPYVSSSSLLLLSAVRQSASV